MRTRSTGARRGSTHALVLAVSCFVLTGCELAGDEVSGRAVIEAPRTIPEPDYRWTPIPSDPVIDPASDDTIEDLTSEPDPAADEVSGQPVTETPRPFPEADYLWTPIPSDPVIDPASDRMIEDLTSEPNPASALLADYAIPVFTATADDPSFPIECRDERDVPCQPSQLDAIRIPTGASPNAGSDQAMVVVDLVDDVTYELWRAVDNGDIWSVQWGSVNSLGGDGTTTSGGSGSGLSRLVGIIRSEELRRGEINHALALASNATCADEFREPAWSTDGSSDDETCIPMGSRLQLDPSVDLSTLELTDGERVIAEALQRYGGYVVDSSASPLAIFFEYEPSASDPDDLGPTAKALGFRWDYDSLPGIPWDHLRVLRTWSGGLDNSEATPEAPPTYAE